MTTREEVIERRRGASDKDIRRVMEICRSAVNRYYGRSALQYVAPHVDKEDLAQDCIIGWLEGKDIYMTLLMKARSLMPINNVTYAKGKTDPVSFVEFDEANFETDTDMYTKVLAQECMDKIEDGRIRFVLEAYYIMEMTLAEIADILELSSRASVHYLRERGLSIIRGEKTNGN